jgi:hypothetical protein
MVHQVPLHNKELRHQTEHQILLLLFIYFNLFLMVHQVLLHNKESRHQTGNQTFIIIIIMIIVYLNCASGAAPRQ